MTHADSGRTLVRIDNVPRDYDWGSDRAIADYLGRAPSGGPEAELWLGAHPAWPARLADGTGLDTHLTATGAGQPGILLKVLAAARPLSLQAHPSPSQARDGFAREEGAGVPIDARERSYKDARSKPEMLVAVTPFEALSGFRAAPDSLAVVTALAELDDRVHPFAERLASSPGEAFAWMLEAGGAQAAVVDGVVAAAEHLDERHATDADTVRRIASTYPADPGIAIALLLHRVSLHPGEALALPAGNLHAYLDGLGIELMEASDNVLRGGLTSKHVDRDELLRVVDTTPIDDPRLPGEPIEDAIAYRPAMPFELRHVHGEHHVGVTGPAVVLAVAAATVTDGVDTLELGAGEAAYADGGDLRVASPDSWLAIQLGDTPEHG